MALNPASHKPNTPVVRWAPLSLGAGVFVIWLALVINAVRLELWGLVGLSAFGAVAFVIGALVAQLPHRARMLAHVDAAAAGAMLAAAVLLVAPHAVIDHAGSGVAGLLIGLIGGAGLHYVGSGHHGRSILAALTLHALCAGVALGALYSLLPTLGWAVGIAILAHKAPAGYVLARRIQTQASSLFLITFPALGTGLGALSIVIMGTSATLPAGLIFGTSAGLFVFVALAFLASGAIQKRHSAAEWVAFTVGGTVVAITGWVTPHGI